MAAGVRRRLAHPARLVLRRGLHGPPGRWDQIRQNYQQLIPHLTQHADLEYVLHEVAGELNSGHVYVQRADDSSLVTRKPGGMLGAEIEAMRRAISASRASSRARTGTRRCVRAADRARGEREGRRVHRLGGRGRREERANFYALLENRPNARSSSG
jgi:hypothetical protein